VTSASKYRSPAAAIAPWQAALCSASGRAARARVVLGADRILRAEPRFLECSEQIGDQSLRHAPSRRLEPHLGEAPVAVECAAEYFATQMCQAEKTLQDGHPFLVGRRFTTDILIASCLSWAVNYRVR
jgi:hypothetical protein